VVAEEWLAVTLQAAVGLVAVGQVQILEMRVLRELTDSGRVAEGEEVALATEAMEGLES
jgi:hypothetical protein